MKARYIKRNLIFNKPSGTSRGVLLDKPSWYLFLYEEDCNWEAIGEISIIPGLSVEDENAVNRKLGELVECINSNDFLDSVDLEQFPAIKFGLEMALLDYRNYGNKVLFKSDFTEGKQGIPTNGLIWMGNTENMINQVREKLELGFRCLKLKIGADNLEQELKILEDLRKKYSKDKLELRVDANGAFTYKNAAEILNRLSMLEVHSIEQPIMAGQIEYMADLCSKPSIPIALDEELIGISMYSEKYKLLNSIKPQYIILKPSLLGGFKESNEWICIAEELGIGWWVTSALESNVGLSAISQWVAHLDTEVYQGLGLGNLYKENIDCPLILLGEKLFYDPTLNWNYEFVY